MNPPTPQPPAPISIGTLLLAIRSGALDQYLLALRGGLVARQEIIKSHHTHKVMSELKPGDRIRIGLLVRPKHYAGATGTVRELKQTKVVIDLDHHPARGNVRGLIVPASLVEKTGSILYTNPTSTEHKL